MPVVELRRGAPARAIGLPERGGNVFEDDLAQRVFNYVEAHYAEHISLCDVARELGYSAPHLTHTFRRLTGTAVTAWIIRRRIRAAQQLLLDGDGTVASVCECVGFNDLCYFTRQFARITGMTPRRYRTAERSVVAPPKVS